MIYDLISLVSSWTFLIIGIATFFFPVYLRQRTQIPVLNSYKYDFFRRQAYHQYNTNAQALLAQGIKKHQGPVGMLVPGGIKIILPATFTDWVTSSKDLDHQQLVRDEYFASYPGFVAQYVAHHPGRMLIDIVRSKLAQNESIVPVIGRHLSGALSECWGEKNTWHKIDWLQDSTAVVSRAAAAVFIGPEKCEDPDWQNLIQSYVSEFFLAVSELHTWPSWLRPAAQWFLPHCSALRKKVPKARAIVREIVRNRIEESQLACTAGMEPPIYNDVIAWTMSNATAVDAEYGDIQLALGMVALFTTSEALRQVLIDVAQDAHLAEALRKEIDHHIRDNGLTLNTLFQLELLDSVLKESQRCAAPLVGLERLVIRDTVLPNGVPLPKGSHIMVDSSEMQSPEIYPNPEVFDGYRFLKLRQKGEKNTLFVQSSQQHNIFGGGKHRCPGRFFANNELKMCLIYILARYDIRLAKNSATTPLRFGFYVVTNPDVDFEVRRRPIDPDYLKL